MRGLIPDALSGLRILLVGVFLFLLEEAHQRTLQGAAATSPIVGAVGVAVVIGATDVIDGWIARKVSAEPRPFGAILDAAADRVFQWAAVLYLTFRVSTAVTPLPGWFVWFLAGREVLLVAAWKWLVRGFVPSLEHALHGKAATVSVFLLIVVATVGASEPVVLAMTTASAVAVTYSTGRYLYAMASAAPPPPAENSGA